MADGRALVSFLNDTDIILTLLFFSKGKIEWRLLISPHTFFLQCSMATSAFLDKSVCVPLLICRPSSFFFSAIFFFLFADVGNILW